MPKHYLNFKVRGFRSLRNTSFRLNQGINVLVGPNGSGKTNVAALLDFLSTFIQSGLYPALAGSGGAARVFSQELFRDSNSSGAVMSITVSGVLGHRKFEDRVSVDKSDETRPITGRVNFDYHLSLRLDRKSFLVTISAESLSWNIISDGIRSDTETVIASGIDASINRSTLKLDERVLSERIGSLFKGILFDSLIDTVHKEAVDFEQTLHNNALSGKSIFSALNPFNVPDIYEIAPSLSFARSSNISPDKVRQDEDISTSGNIEPDGSGTMGKLFKLSSSSTGRPRKDSTYGRILDAFYKINEHISALVIKPDLRTGKLDAELRIGTGKSVVKAPFSWASDGTAKWLAILTLIRTRGAGYCIEEPENYIHPAAQRVFMAVLRDVCDSRPRSFYVINTHSETVVNEAAPAELLVCDYRAGTIIRRIKKPDELLAAINETGFGLGHLYANQRV